MQLAVLNQVKLAGIVEKADADDEKSDEALALQLAHGKPLRPIMRSFPGSVKTNLFSLGLF